MQIGDAQKNVRETFMGGFAGCLVSAATWSLSAAVCTWSSLRAAEFVIFIVGFFNFPLTQLFLRSLGRPYALPKGHPMNALAMQVAFTLPLTLPLVYALAAYRPAWFFPALMVVLGAHYLPFTFLYGMSQFAVLGGILIAAGIAIALYLPTPVSLGAWLTAAILLIFAFVGRQEFQKSQQPVI